MNSLESHKKQLRSKLLEVIKNHREKIAQSLEKYPEVAKERAMAIMEKHFLCPLQEISQQLESQTNAIVIYIVGPSGSCKSYLINCLVGKKVADTGTIAPQTAQSNIYENIPHVNAKFVDTRGLFEGNNPTSKLNAEADLFRQAQLKVPDIVLCCVTRSQYRNLGDDYFKFLAEFQKKVPSNTPFIFVLTKMDENLPDDIDPNCIEDRPKMFKVGEDDIKKIAASINPPLKFHDYVYCMTRYKMVNGNLDLTPTINIEMIRETINKHCSLVSQLYISETVPGRIMELENAFANKIIIISSIATALLAPVPIVEGVLCIWLRSAMLHLLSECISTDKSELNDFENLWQMKILLGCSVAQSIAASVLDLMAPISLGVGYMVSTATSAVTQPFITSYIGHNYLKYLRKQETFGNFFGKKLISNFASFGYFYGQQGEGK